MSLNNVDTALILTALRLLQEEMQRNLRRVEKFPQLSEIDFKSITLEDIDDLCEKINFNNPPIILGKDDVTINPNNTDEIMSFILREWNEDQMGKLPLRDSRVRKVFEDYYAEHNTPLPWRTRHDKI